MATLIPFQPRRVHEAAAYALALSARWTRLSRGKPWLPAREPERLGNHLQRLAHTRPALVYVIENLVAEIVRQLES